jgi:hypothetical protein
LNVCIAWYYFKYCCINYGCDKAKFTYSEVIFCRAKWRIYRGPAKGKTNFNLRYTSKNALQKFHVFNCLIFPDLLNLWNTIPQSKVMRPLHSSLFYYSNPFLKKKKEQLKLITNQ